MTDSVSPERRSWIMAQVRSRDTKPELRLRSLIHRLGYRYALHRRDLPGAPDLVFVSRRKMLFLHGCFWHGHSCRRGRRVPATNRDYWTANIRRNRSRDRRNQRALRERGWRFLIVWECALKSPNTLIARVRRFLGQ